MCQGNVLIGLQRCAWRKDSPHSRCDHRASANKSNVRETNIESAKAVADAVRTSLGPRGMDKMVGWSCQRLSVAMAAVRSAYSGRLLHSEA